MMDSHKVLADTLLEAIALIEKKESIPSITQAMQKLNSVLVSPTKSNDQTLELLCLFYLAKAQSLVGEESRTSAILESLSHRAWSLYVPPIAWQDWDIPDDKGISTILCVARISLAKLYQERKMYNEAIKCFSEVADELLQKEDKKTVFLIYQELANMYNQINDIKREGEMWQKVLEIMGDKLAPSARLHVNFRIGQGYYSAGDLENAILYESTALRYAGGTEYEFKLTHNLAEFTFLAQRYRDCIPFLKKLLQFKEAQEDIQGTIVSLLRLSASYQEIGDYLKGMTFLEKAKALLEAQKRTDGIEYAFYLEGKAQTLIDTKEFNKAKDCILQAERLLKLLHKDLRVLDKLRVNIERGENPLFFDCVHKSINMSFISVNEELPDVEHTNLQPIVPPIRHPFITSTLSDEDRAKFHSIDNRLTERPPIRRLSEGTTSQPDRWEVYHVYEYVDDLEEFEIKWEVYKKEKRKGEKVKKLQDRWSSVEELHHYKKEGTIERTGHLALYLAEIVNQVRGYVSIDDKETTRAFALHAADFLEAYTENKSIALQFWKIRAELLLTIYPVAQTPAKRLLELEILHSLKNADELVKYLNQEEQIAVLPFLFKIWWDAEHILMDSRLSTKFVEMAKKYTHFIYSKSLLNDGRAPIYAYLSAATFEVTEQIIEFYLKYVSALIYGIALYKQKRYQETVDILDKIFPISNSPSEFSDSKKYEITLEAQLALANSRVLIRCPDLDAWDAWLGPFAPYIYAEISGQPVEAFSLLNQDAYSENLPGIKHLRLAFVDENFIVMQKNLQRKLHGVVLHHEVHHSLKRLVGQQLRTEAGQWINVKRDVPVASAKTYYILLKNFPGMEKEPIYLVLTELFAIGQRCVASRREASYLFIQNMLRYFDGLAPQESNASYPCAAILVGMAFGLFGEKCFEEVYAYISHLAVFDHEEAMKQGRAKAKLGM